MSKGNDTFERDLLTLSLSERQFIQAIGVRLRSLKIEEDLKGGELEGEEFMLYSGDNALTV